MKDAANKFIKFLEEKGVLEEYKARFANGGGSDDLKDWLKSSNPSDFILSAFFWGHANEEAEKWGVINYRWKDFIKQDGAK